MLSTETSFADDVATRVSHTATAVRVHTRKSSSWLNSAQCLPVVSSKQGLKNGDYDACSLGMLRVTFHTYRTPVTIRCQEIKLRGRDGSPSTPRLGWTPEQNEDHEPSHKPKCIGLEESI